MLAQEVRRFTDIHILLFAVTLRADSHCRLCEGIILSAGLKPVLGMLILYIIYLIARKCRHGRQCTGHYGKPRSNWSFHKR